MYLGVYVLFSSNTIPQNHHKQSTQKISLFHNNITIRFLSATYSTRLYLHNQFTVFDDKSEIDKLKINIADKMTGC
jgi:hypothetical protein